MKITTVILGLTVAIIVIYFIWTKLVCPKTEPHSDETRPSNVYLPEKEVQNDKLVMVNNITNSEIDKILTGFCNLYNKESFTAVLRLYKLNERQFAITFPYDIEFQFFCFFVNYVCYPMGFNKSFEVTGWTTTKSGQTGITEKSANKEVMLFIPNDDTEYDNVYLTTDDNIGYKLGFAVGHKKQLLELPKKRFAKRSIESTELIGKEIKDYK
jgi:hypothetical protein